MCKYLGSNFCLIHWCKRIIYTKVVHEVTLNLKAKQANLFLFLFLISFTFNDFWFFTSYRANGISRDTSLQMCQHKFYMTQHKHQPILLVNVLLSDKSKSNNKSVHPQLLCNKVIQSDNNKKMKMRSLLNKKGPKQKTQRQADKITKSKSY